MFLFSFYLFLIIRKKLCRCHLGLADFCLLTLKKGTRLGVSEHPEDNLNVFKFRLSDTDRADIEAVLDRSNGRKMITLIGDCGAEYR